MDEISGQFASASEELENSIVYVRCRCSLRRRKSLSDDNSYKQPIVIHDLSPCNRR